jgi:hypothetical protein
MLTPAYPGGLFGDAPGPAADAPPAGYGTPPGYGTAPGYGAPGEGYGSPQPSSQPAGWRLVLSSGTKQLLGVFVGLGAVLIVLEIVLIAIAAGSSNT